MIVTVPPNFALRFNRECSIPTASQVVSGPLLLELFSEEDEELDEPEVREDDDEVADRTVELEEFRDELLLFCELLSLCEDCEVDDELLTELVDDEDDELCRLSASKTTSVG